MTDVVEGDGGRNVTGTKSLVSGTLGEKQAAWCRSGEKRCGSRKRPARIAKTGRKEE